MMWKTLIFLLMMNVSLHNYDPWELLAISVNVFIGRGVVEKKNIKAVFKLFQIFTI